MASELRLQIGTPADPFAVSIATGEMLNVAQSTSGYDDRSFYISYTGAAQNAAADWELTYSHAQNPGDQAGKMVTMRLTQAVYLNDASGTRDQDMVLADAQENTAHFIAQIPDYREHGVLAWSVGLEGGNAQNQASDPNFDSGDFTVDGTNGSRSPLAADGLTWKTGRRELVEDVIEALNEQGMVCCLGLYYNQLYYWHSSQANYRAAMGTVTDMLIENGYRNVCIDLANEAGVDAAGGWTSGTNVFGSDANVANELDYLRGLWTGEPWRPPIGCSSRSMPGPLTIAESDVHWYHGNVSGGVSNKPLRVQDILDDSTVGPVVMNEDENVQGATEFQAGPSTAGRTNAVDDELEAFDLVHAIDGASGGTMLASMWQRWKVDQATKTGFMPELGPSTDINHATYLTAYANLTRLVLEERRIAHGRPSRPLAPGGAAVRRSLTATYLAALTLALTPSIADGATLYVAPSGSGSACTSLGPCATFDAAYLGRQARGPGPGRRRHLPEPDHPGRVGPGRSRRGVRACARGERHDQPGPELLRQPRRDPRDAGAGPLVRLQRRAPRHRLRRRHATVLHPLGDGHQRPRRHVRVAAGHGRPVDQQHRGRLPHPATRPHRRDHLQTDLAPPGRHELAP